MQKKIKREEFMRGRIALITGGTRGIGASIAIELKRAGYSVGTTYHGNEENAEQFKRTHGLEVFRWDVGDYEACQQGIQRVRERLGEIDILVNNAGITKDVMLLLKIGEQLSIQTLYPVLICLAWLLKGCARETLAVLLIFPQSMRKGGKQAKQIIVQPKRVSSALQKR
jgi:NAD(P)-dependent dehydrogenase (short-subunit alcohol dehydrogenase family)